MSNIQEWLISTKRMVEEQYLQYAADYERAGQFKMAAQCYRSANRMNKYYECLADYHHSEGNSVESVNHLIRAIEEKRNSQLFEKIDTRSSKALDSVEASQKEKLLANLAHCARISTNPSQQHRFDAERYEMKQRWEKANSYIRAENFGRALYCVERISNKPLRQASMYIDLGDENRAWKIMELFIRKEIPSKLIAVEIALGKKSILEKFIDNLDEPKLVELVKKNIPNIELAIKLAGSNRKLKEKVEREVLTELLNKRKRTLNETKR